MAKYDVTYSCGHTETVELYGPRKERERKIKFWEESGLCKECWEKKKEDKVKDKYPDIPEIVAISQAQKDYAQHLRQEFLNSQKGRICAELDALIGTKNEAGEVITEKSLKNNLRDKLELRSLAQYETYKELLTMDEARDVIDTIKDLGWH